MNRPDPRTSYAGTGSSQEIPKATLKDFIAFHIERDKDYATVFALACKDFGDLNHFETLFDLHWERYEEVRKLQN